MDNNRKKILLITFSDNADHQEVVYSLFEELVEKSDVWAMGINQPKVQHIDDNHIVFVDAPKRPGVEKETFNIPELLKIIKFIRKSKFDVIYFETLHTWNIPIWLFHAKETKIIQAIHDVDPHGDGFQAKLIELMNKIAVRCVDTILLRNKIFIELLQKKYGVPGYRIKVLEPWRRFPEYQPEIHSHRALFFGRISRYKGVEYLLDIVQECSDVQFDIVGRVEPTVSELVGKLKRFSNVHLHTEYVTDEEMRQYFAKDDFVILPYKSASQSGVILDANKFGRPSIAFAVGAIENQIESGVNGVLIKAGNVRAFSEAVKQLASIPDKTMDLFSKSSYDYAFNRFSSKCAASKFIEIIENEVCR